MENGKWNTAESEFESELDNECSPSHFRFRFKSWKNEVLAGLGGMQSEAPYSWKIWRNFQSKTDTIILIKPFITPTTFCLTNFLMSNVNVFSKRD